MAIFEIVFVDDNLLFLFVLRKKDVWDDVKTFAASYDFVLQKDGRGSTSCHFVFYPIFDSTSKIEDLGHALP